MKRRPCLLPVLAATWAPPPTRRPVAALSERIECPQDGIKQERVERFTKICVAASGPRLLQQVGPSAGNNDYEAIARPRVGFDALRRIEPFQVRHAHIHENRQRLLSQGRAHAVFGVRLGRRPVPEVREAGGPNDPRIGIVVDDEHEWHVRLNAASRYRARPEPCLRGISSVHALAQALTATSKNET